MARTFVKGSDIASLTITTTNLADAAVVTAKLGDAAVTTAKIAGAAVDTSKLGDAAVSTAKLADNAVTAAKLADNSVDTASLIDANVTNVKIADGAVNAPKLATDAVETAKIKDLQVTTAKIADNAVEPGKANLSVAWTFSDLRGTFGANVSANNFKLQNLANPTTGTDAANKAYVDGVVQGLDVKESCVVISLNNINLTGTQTIDGVALTAGQRVLVAGQTNGVENGIYAVQASAWVRTADMAPGSDAAGAFTFIEQGTANADSGWVCTNNKGSAVVGTDALAFSQFSGAGQIVAGNGLSKTGNTLDVNVGNGIQILSDAVALKLNGANPGLKVDGAGLAVLLNAGATGTVRPAIAVDGSGLAIKVDDSTIDADGAGQLRVKGAGITTAQLADNAVTAAKLADNAVDTAAIIDLNVTYAKLSQNVKETMGRFDSYIDGQLAGSAPFTISLTNPQNLDQALLVFLNGVMRTKDVDYTLSGSTLTFDASVGVVGDDFAVYYGQTHA